MFDKVMMRMKWIKISDQSNRCTSCMTDEVHGVLLKADGFGRGME